MNIKETISDLIDATILASVGTLSLAEIINKIIPEAIHYFFSMFTVLSGIALGFFFKKYLRKKYSDKKDEQSSSDSAE